MSDEQIDELFEEFLAAPELSSWVSDLSAREHAEAQRIFRKLVRRAMA